MSHANEALSPIGRTRLARLIVDDGWPVRRAAERLRVSPETAARWASRYRAGQPMTDRPSTPHRSPSRCSQHLERRVIALRFTHRWGEHRIAYRLRVPHSTVGAILTRYRMPRLSWLDQATGLPVRRLPARRYEHAAPGDLVHMDIKKLGRIPDGGGWKAHGRGSGKALAARRAKQNTPRGFAFLHHVVDDHSRLAYSEILVDERKQTVTEFWQRARDWFAGEGVTIKAVLTDNGPAYHSKQFNQTLTEAGIRHRYTRPYRPQTNGKVERFNRTLATEWAYARPYQSETERADCYQDWIHYYNHHRPHTGIGGQTPSQRVHNVTGKNN